MRKRKIRQFEESLLGNIFTFDEYKKILLNLAISVFDWSNLPNSCDERFIELCLVTRGSVCFFIDDVTEQMLSLKCNFSGGFDVYRNPLKRQVFADNGYRNTLNIENSVICYNDLLRQNNNSFIENYAYKLYEIDRTLITNLKAQKTPILIQCDENQKLSMLNLYKEYDGNQPFIFGDKNLDLQSISVLKTDAPYLCDSLFKLKSDIFNEALTFLGIPNISVQKKERMLRDEVQQMNGGSIASRFTRLKARRQAVKKINKMFNTNITVDFSDFDTDSEEGESE